MGRVVKTGPVRREEILDAAHALFAAEGYDATSVSRIIERVGLSKGAFYHHFPSKEALLHALIERMSDGAIAAIDSLVARPDLGPRDKLDAFFSGAREAKRAHAPELRAAWRSLASPSNLPLRQALTRRARDRAAPLLARVLEEGVAARVFDCPPTVAWARFVLGCLATCQEDLFDALLDDALDEGALARHAEVMAEAVARLVGDREHRPPVSAVELIRAVAGRDG